MPHYPEEIEYSDKYMDDHYEYRHVILPKDVYKKMPRGRLLSENVDWRCNSGMESDGSSAISRLGTLLTAQTIATYFTVQTPKGNRSPNWTSSTWVRSPSRLLPILTKFKPGDMDIKLNHQYR